MPNCYNRYIAHRLIVYVIIGTVNYLPGVPLTGRTAGLIGNGPTRHAAIHSLSFHARRNLARAVLPRKRFADGYCAARRGSLVGDGLARRAPDRRDGRRRSVDQQGWHGTPRPDR